MADVIGLDVEMTTGKALEQAAAWVELAMDGFDPSTIDYVALDGVKKAIEAVNSGLRRREELERQGIKPPDRTFRRLELV